MRQDCLRIAWIAALLSICASGAGASVARPITEGLIGYWNFDETSGAVLHDSSPGHQSSDGQLYNFPTDNSQWMLGRIGKALQYDGSNDLVIVPNYLKPTTSVSFTGWVWADVNTIWYQSVVKNWGNSQAGQFHFGIYRDSRKIELALRQSNGAQAWCLDSAELPTGQWVFLAFVADAGAVPQPSVKVYRDGEVVASMTYDGTLLSPPMSAMGVGVKTNDAGTWADPYNPGFWDGKFDDFGLWNRPLTAGEVLAIYRAGLHSLPLTAAVVVDLNGDGDVDADDFDFFEDCATGPGIPQSDEDCDWARLDGDEDVDQSDFAVFQRCFSGENVSANPNCVD